MNKQSIWKRLALVGMFSAGIFTFSARADDPKPDEPKPTTPAQPPLDPQLLGRRIRQITLDLKLPQEVQQKVDGIISASMDKLKTMLDDFQGKQTPVEERRDLIQKWSQDMRDQISALLSDEQKKAFEEKISQIRNTGPGGFAQFMFDRIQGQLDKLTLSDEQKAKLKKVFDDAQEHLKDAMQAAGGNRAGLLEKARSIRDEVMKGIESVLTPDQLKTFRDLMNGGTGKPDQGGADKAPEKAPEPAPKAGN